MGCNYKVGFATADWSQSVIEEDGTPTMGGSGWIRIGQYRKYLPDLNNVIGTLVFNNSLGIFGVTDWEEEHHFDCEIIYMQRWMFDSIGENIKIARKNGQTIINDLDDWYWGLHTTHFAKSKVDPRLKKDQNIVHYRNAIANSDLVVVSTPFLEEKAKTKLGAKNVVILENHVDFDRFTPRKHQEGKTIIGWHGSTGHRSDDLNELKGIFPQLPEEQFSFHHTGYYGGHPTFWEETGVTQQRVSLYPMVSPTKLPRMLPFDIGVCPLNDIPFNHAKSWIKPLEYAAAGIPFVTSKAPEYFRFREEYGVGRIARKFIEWQRAFRALSDPEVRAEEAQRNWNAVQNLDVKKGALRLEKILESVR